MISFFDFVISTVEIGGRAMPAKFVTSLSRTLDARPDRLDLRDREYVPLVRSLPPSFPDDRDIRTLLPAYVKARLVRDQKKEGSCTGFGLACVVNYLLFRRALELGAQGTADVESVSPRMLYHLARFYDEWPGEDYEGSSCRGALKAWHKHGVCREGLWPYLDAKGDARFVRPDPNWDRDAMERRLGVYYRINRSSVVDIQAAILQIGAVYVSASVHDGWGLGESRKAFAGHASLPRIGPLRRRDSIGGHAFALVGFNPSGFVVQNSWGTTWGLRGFAVLPYDEWVTYGTDAWICALGVPGDARTTEATKSSKVIVRSTTPVVIAQAGGVAFGTKESSPRPAVSKAVEPWNVEHAYRHTIVMGNDGRVINRIVTHESGAAGVQEIVVEAPRAWFGDDASPKKLLVYAHGGLNSEETSVERIRVLAPYFTANGIYPLFVTWRTGPIETLSDMLEDELARLPKPEAGIVDFFERVKETVSDVLDRTIEVVAGPVAKPIWSQMKQNAAAASDNDRGCFLIADALARLAGAVTNLELHVVGHSAGSIILGHLLDLLRDVRLPVRTCSLYAPACTVQFALDHYAASAAGGTLNKRELHLHLLSDAREREDTVGPYRKSLLYLVSRALESCHRMPLLGFAEVFNPSAKAVRQWNRDEQSVVVAWQKFWGAGIGNLHLLDEQQVSTGTNGRRIKAGHGCFDNDAGTIMTTLRRVLGAAPRHPVESLDY